MPLSLVISIVPVVVYVTDSHICRTAVWNIIQLSPRPGKLTAISDIGSHPVDIFGGL